MGVTDIVCRLYNLVNENYQQELGCHSSGWWRNRWGKDCLSSSCCTFLDLNEWICSEGLLPMKEDDILKQRQSFYSIRWLSASSCSDSGSLTMETAIVAKSHLKKWLSSLPRGVNQGLEILSLRSRWAGARRAAFLRTFSVWIGEF